MKVIILFFSLIIQFKCFSQVLNKSMDTINCNCEKLNRENIFSNNKDCNFSICGFLEKKVSNSEFIVKSPIVTICNQSTPLIDYSKDEINEYIINITDKGILLFTTQLVLIGDNWEYSYVKYSKQFIKCCKEKISVSNKKNIFKAPKLSEKQKDDILKLCSELKTNNKSVLALDEKSIYKLYMGHLNKDKVSTDLLKNYRKLFTVDGSIAETLTEIGF